jgi:site-specific recombinase XerD
MGYGHYLVRVQTTYHFRYTLPTWAIGNSKPIQLKKSLAIHDVKTAKKLSMHLASQVHLFVTTSNLEFVEMNQDERKRVLFRFLEQQISDWKSAHANGPRLTKEQHQEQVKSAQASRQDVLWDIQSSNLKPSLEKISKIYKQLGIEDEADKNDAYDFAQTEALFHQFVEMTLSGKIEMAQRLIDRNRPDEPIQQPTQEVPDEPLISVLIEEYLTEHKDVWAPRTLINYTSDLRVFLRLIDDAPINKFTKQDFNKLRETLKVLPKHNTKDKGPISIQRANNIISNISSFFQWCNVERDVINTNLAHGRNLPKPKNGKKRERFTQSDLELIFTSEQFKQPNPKKMYDYWVPILGYYTGMRLAEICLLRKEDIYQTEDGIWAISLNEKHRTLKNSSSVREIPIYKDIIKLSFIEFVQSCKDDCLFKTSSKNGHHDDAIGKSFGRFKKSLGFGSNKVFHCFRNTFIDEVFQQGLDMTLYKDYIGHKQDDITHGVYASRASVKRLKEGLLDKIVFPVNLTLLIKR